MMLAGAVSGADPMFVNMGFSIFQAYPANNIHAPFDKNSQGLFAGEGAGMMVLKRHSDAVRDGDKIHAIIKGGALSNDGKGEFVLSPNTKGQVLVYERAYDNAAALIHAMLITLNVMQRAHPKVIMLSLARWILFLVVSLVPKERAMAVNRYLAQ